MTDPITPISSTPLVIHGIFALAGAFVHASQVYRGGGTKNFMDFILLTIMSSFSGVMFALVAIHFLGDSYLTMAIAGTGGFLGVEGMTYLVTLFKQKFIK